MSARSYTLHLKNSLVSTSIAEESRGEYKIGYGRIVDHVKRSYTPQGATEVDTGGGGEWGITEVLVEP